MTSSDKSPASVREALHQMLEALLTVLDRNAAPFATMATVDAAGKNFIERMSPSAAPAVQPAAPVQETVVDLDAAFWKGIKAAADESKWMPPDYTATEWVADVCQFLRDGSCAQVEQAQPQAARLESALREIVRQDIDDWVFPNTYYEHVQKVAREALAPQPPADTQEERCTCSANPDYCKVHQS